MERIFENSGHNCEEVRREMEAQVRYLQEINERDLQFRKYHRPSYKKKLKHR